MIWPGPARRDGLLLLERGLLGRELGRALRVDEGGDLDLGVEARLEVGDGLLDVVLVRPQGRELGVELVADLRLLVLLAFEVGLLVLELAGERGQPLGDRRCRSGWPGRAAAGAERRRPRRWRRRRPRTSCPGACTRTPRAGGRTRAAPAPWPWCVAIESWSLAMSSRVCSSWWSAVENCAAVSLAAARASDSFCRAAVEVVAGRRAGPGRRDERPRPGTRARARRGRRRGCGEERSCASRPSGWAPGDQGTLAAGRRAVRRRAEAAGRAESTRSRGSVHRGVGARPVPRGTR